MSDSLADEIAELPTLTREQLRARWRTALRQPAPTHLRKQLLVPMLAYKLQEREYGGLKPHVRRCLRELASRFAADPKQDVARHAGPARMKPDPADPRLAGREPPRHRRRERLRVSRTQIWESLGNRPEDNRNPLVGAAVLRTPEGQDVPEPTMTSGTESLIRCAIYTRKSSEEGLEQSFNSLDAQREACQAYIQSQRQEGWRALADHYDDGGFSGGSMDRPALRRLMADIEASRIDTVVVYKVDRLTRSLADFAKIVEAFDARGVTFVSVTQQFNTTTSMGRLTLNVLLSFAQFGREVTGERIRDKIAASKRKGMWMGGRVPLGYDLKDRHLIPNSEEAEHVGEIFDLYLELGCVRRMKTRLDEQGTTSKVRISAGGVRSGGEPYSRGALYKILQNRLYLGEIPHKGESYPGEHTAIIDRKLWERVQAKLKENARASRHGGNASAPSLLRGLVFDPDGHRFTPSHAVKSGKGYRYYVSQRIIRGEPAPSGDIGRIPARDLENAVLSQIREFLGSADQLLSSFAPEDVDVPTTRRLLGAAEELAKELDGGRAAAGNELLAALGARVVVRREAIQVFLPKHQLRTRLLGAADSSVSPKPDEVTDAVSLKVPCRLKRCGGEMRMILPAQSSDTGKPVTSLLKAVSRAHDWIRRIESGEFKDQRAIATATGLDERYVSHILPAAFLAPEIVEMIVEGMQSPDLSLNELLRGIPLDWTMQVGEIADGRH